jgi:hypothetical protein
MALISRCWDPATVSAPAAILDSFAGAFASTLSAWITQRQREQLYSDFISESARAMVDATYSFFARKVATATERAKSVVAKIPGGVKIPESAETPRFSGLAIASLYSDPQPMSKSGSVAIAALEYGFKDFNGKQPPSLREQNGSPRPFLTKS